LLLVVDLLFLFFELFEHTGVEFVLIFRLLGHRPLLFCKDCLNVNLGLVVVLKVEFDLAICSMKLDSVLFCPEDSALLKISEEIVQKCQRCRLFSN